MTKKIITTFMSIFAFIGISLASAPLDSALIASKLKQYEMFRTEYQYDSILYVTNIIHGHKAAHAKMIINSQTAEMLETEMFEMDYSDNSWSKIAKTIYLFDEKGNTVSQISFNEDSSEGERINYFYNKDGLRVKAIQYNLIDKKWVENDTVIFKYGVLGDTISVMESDESMIYYYNDTISISYNNDGNWEVFIKEAFDFNEDGSIHTIKLITDMDDDMINEFHFYYKTKTEIAKIFNLTNYSLRNKHLYMDSKAEEKLRIYSISGRLVATKNNYIGENIHDLSSLASGVYILRTDSGGAGKIILK